MFGENNFPLCYHNSIPFVSSEISDPLEFELIDSENFQQKAIVIRNLLTESECDQLLMFIMQKDRPANYHDEPILTPAGSKASFRNNLRISVKSDQISELLFSRIQPILASINEESKLCSPSNSHEFLTNGFGMFGIWRLSSLNNCFRLCKYNPLGHFGPHFDSDYVIDPMEERSLKTFMIYLNDDYEGGETNFLMEHDLYFDETQGIYRSPPTIPIQNSSGTLEHTSPIIASLKARKGDCLIFDHKLFHEGGQVTRGEKYIMRTDIMYKKISSTTSSSSSPSTSSSPSSFEKSELRKEIIMDEKEGEEERKRHDALKIFYAGMTLEGEGKVDEACKYYRRAIKLCPELEGGV